MECLKVYGPRNHYERHFHGDRVILVVGAGKSSHARLSEDVAVMGVNPRHDGFDHAVSIDQEYWSKHFSWRFITGAAFTMQGVHGPTPRGLADNVIQFIPPAGDDKTRRHTQGIVFEDGTRCGLSGPHAVALARYMTSGPVVLAGFDLDYMGTHQEHLHDSERARQIPCWQKFLAKCENVFAHPEMTGPLREMLPTYEGCHAL